MAVNWKRLTDPFPADAIEWRVGRSGVKSGKVWATCLAYVTARAIQDRLDEVFSPANWKNEYRPGVGGGAICRIWFREPDGEWSWREDGAGGLDASGGLSKSDAEKGTYSNALKRAGSALGCGRYLYRLEEEFAKIHDNGKHYAEVKDPDDPSGKRKIRYRWDPPQLPAWALPDASADNEWTAAAKRLETLAREVDVLRKQAGETDEGPEAAEQWAAQIINSALGDLTALGKAIHRMEQRQEELVARLESAGT